MALTKKGRPKLSYRCVDQATGEDISDQLAIQPNISDERDSGNKRGRDKGDNKDRDSRDDDKNRKKKRGFFS